MLRPFTDTNFGVKSVTVKFNINKQPVYENTSYTISPQQQRTASLGC